MIMTEQEMDEQLEMMQEFDAEEKKKELLTCPFCGEEFEIVGKGRYFAHKTNGCILQHLCFEAEDEEAIERWNIRKPMERIVERLEEELIFFKKKMAECVIKALPYYDNVNGCVTGVYKAIEIIKEEMKGE